MFNLACINLVLLATVVSPDAFLANLVHPSVVAFGIVHGGVFLSYVFMLCVVHPKVLSGTVHPSVFLSRVIVSGIFLFCDLRCVVVFDDVGHPGDVLSGVDHPCCSPCSATCASAFLSNIFLTVVFPSGVFLCGSIVSHVIYPEDVLSGVAHPGDLLSTSLLVSNPVSSCLV